MFDDFIGIPFKNRESSLNACDCYGLVRLVYRTLLDVQIVQPSSSAFNSRNIEEEYLKETSSNWYQVDMPELYDVVAMAHDSMHPEIVQHFGIYIGNGKMLHTLKNVGSHIVKLDDYKYFIKGYFRYESSNI